MITSPTEWVRALEQGDPLMGVPLVVCGVVLMFFGWRLWRICVGLTFALVGYTAGCMIGQDATQQIIFALAGAAGLGFLSVGPAKLSVALLGGAVGGGLSWLYLQGLGIDGPMLLVATALCLIAFAALSSINRSLVIVLMTAAEGAVLVLSGMVALCKFMPDVYGVVRGMAAGSMIVVPFIVLVPTAVSFFYQSGEIRRTGAEL